MDGKDEAGGANNQDAKAAAPKTRAPSPHQVFRERVRRAEDTEADIAELVAKGNDPRRARMIAREKNRAPRPENRANGAPENR
ncbi:hypothetical protein ACMAUO_12775 [Gluconacetobacter sp. Hr-1-5]|uniref:hypothetical protein n=1 Tax=Gluconacetobacter sp. Hr-1-5 TaxID=3395370 RepID=UPI003B520CE3